MAEVPPDRRQILAALILVVAGALTWPAHAEEPQYCWAHPVAIQPGPHGKITCSRMFWLQGACDRPNYDGDGWGDVAFAAVPWEPSPITFRQVQLNLVITTTPGEHLGGAFIGNSYNLDPMTRYKYFAGAGTILLELENEFPVETGMVFPASRPDWTDPTKSPHIDVHLNCPKDATYKGHLFLLYTIP